MMQTKRYGEIPDDDSDRIIIPSLAEVVLVIIPKYISSHGDVRDPYSKTLAFNVVAHSEYARLQAVSNCRLDLRI